MSYYEVIPFECEDKEYEIRIASDGATIHIRAFYQNKPANGYSYQVDIMKHFDLRRLMGFDAIKDFINSAKEDISTKRWERFLEAMETVNQS